MGMEDKLSAPPDFDGPVRNRKCTDIIFLVAIVAMWIAMTAVGIASVREVRTIRCEYVYSYYLLQQQVSTAISGSAFTTQDRRAGTAVARRSSLFVLV